MAHPPIKASKDKATSADGKQVGAEVAPYVVLTLTVGVVECFTVVILVFCVVGDSGGGDVVNTQSSSVNATLDTETRIIPVNPMTMATTFSLASGDLI